MPTALCGYKTGSAAALSGARSSVESLEPMDLCTALGLLQLRALGHPVRKTVYRYVYFL